MHTETDIDETARMTDPDKLGCSSGMRIGQDLIKATAPFAEEDVTKSWWLVGSTFILLIAAPTGFQTYAVFQVATQDIGV